MLSRDEVAGCCAQPRGHRAAGAARPRAAGDDVRLRPARVGGDRAGGRRRRPRGRRAARPRQGLQGAARPDRPRGGRARCGAYLQRGRPRLVGDRCEAHLFVNQRGGGLTRQGLYKIVQRHAASAGLDGEDEPAHAAPHVRHAPARRRLRPALAAGDARPRRHRDDPALHAPVGRAAAGRLLRRAPARARAPAESIARRWPGARSWSCSTPAARASCRTPPTTATRARTRSAHVAEAAGGLRPAGAAGASGSASIAAAARAARPRPRPCVHGRLHPLGPGKDTITGHWELMGVVTPAPLPHLPRRVPAPRSSSSCSDATGRGVLCNRPYYGIAVIDDFGERAPAHRRPDRLHVARTRCCRSPRTPTQVPPAELYAACAAAREIMRGEHAVGRVIARPFRGEPGAFERTRRPRATSRSTRRRARYLDELRDDGIAGPHRRQGRRGCSTDVGVDDEHPGATNAERARRRRRALIDELRAAASCSRTSSRPTRSTATARTSPGFHGGAAGDRRRGRRVARAAGPGARPARPHRRPRLRPDAPRHRPHARARRRCWRASPATAAAATTGRSPTSARASCAGSPGATRPACPGTAFT